MRKMGFDYFVFYTEASLVCVIILSTILITDRMHNTMQEKQIWFRRAIICFILYFISDACWAAMLSGMFPKVRFFAVLFNFTNYILAGLMAYGLFMFIAASEKIPFRKDAGKRLLVFLPVVISVLVMLIAYVTDPLFWIDEENELNDLYFLMLFTAPSFYLWAGFILSVKYSRKSTSRVDRRRYMIIGTVPLGVIAFGLLQIIVLNAPTFCFGCTVMWLWFYIQNMHAMISVDDLTHLNNRGQINRYLEQIRFSETTRIYIMMIDINRFKKINDTYGHAEGDRALIIVSDVLRSVCEQIKTSVFLGRYGGDEFTIIIKNPQEQEHPEYLSEVIRSALSLQQREKQLPYELELSIGYDEMSDDTDTVYACLNRADEKLYIDKQRNAK